MKDYRYSVLRRIIKQVPNCQAEELEQNQYLWISPRNQNPSQHPGGNLNFLLIFVYIFLLAYSGWEFPFPSPAVLHMESFLIMLVKHAWFTMVLLAIFLILIKLSILSCLSVCFILLLSAYLSLLYVLLVLCLFLINQSSYSCILDTNFFLLVCVTKYSQFVACFSTIFMYPLKKI